MKPILLIIILLFSVIANAQLEQVWKTDFQITSDTFNTFGYKTDGAGNFYLYGWQHNRVFLQKHDANGNIEWTINDNSIVELPSAVVGNDTFERAISNSRITDIAIDSEESIYIVGLTSVQIFSDPHAESYPFISKLKPNAGVLWKKNYSLYFDSVGWTKWNQNLYINSSLKENSVYLSYNKLRAPAFCNGQHNFNFGIIKSDTSGRILWNRSFLGDKIYCSKDITTSLFSLDSLIGLTGFATSPYPSQSKLVSLLLDEDGNLVNRTEEKQFVSDPYSDQSLNLYLPNEFTISAQSKKTTTFLTVQSADSVEQDKKNLLVLKYDPLLNRQWRYDLKKDTGATIEIENATVDDSCNLLISAIWNENGVNKALFLKLDSSGNEKYRDTFSTGIEEVRSLINKHQENILITSSYNGLIFSTSIRKYYPSGSMVWDTTLTIPGKILHARLDSCNLYLVLLEGKTLSYLKIKDNSCKDDPYLKLQTVSRTHASISLSWNFNDTTNARAGFAIERSINGTIFTFTDSTGKDTTHYNDTGLNENTIYYYRVSAYDNNGVYLVSNVVSDNTLTNRVAIPFIDPPKVYPNPATTVIHIEGTQSYNAFIYDLAGNILFEGVKGQSLIHLNNLAPGMYIIVLTDEYHHTSATKIIKQ